MRLKGGSCGGAQDVIESFRSLPYIQQNIISVVFICAGIFGSVRILPLSESSPQLLHPSAGRWSPPQAHTSLHHIC